MTKLEELIQELAMERERLTDLQVEANIAFSRTTDLVQQEVLVDLIDDISTQLRLVTKNLIALRTHHPDVQNAFESLKSLADRSREVAGEMAAAEDKVKAMTDSVAAATAFIKAVRKITLIG